MTQGYDYNHTRRAWKELAQIFAGVAVVTALVLLFGWHGALVLILFGVILYSLFIA